MKVLFTEKIVTKLSEIWIGAPGWDIRNPEKTYPVSRGQKKHRIWDLIPNTAEKYKRISILEPGKLYFMDVKSRVG
jgi:hypothetical protein